MSMQVTEEIDQAFKEVSPLTDSGGLELSPESCSQMVQEGEQLFLKDTSDLMWVISQAMRHVLQQAFASDLSVGLVDLLHELNVQRTYPREAYSRLDRVANQLGKVNDSREIDQAIGAHRQRMYQDFTPEQARAIVHFLDLVSDSQSAMLGRNDWNAAHEYWTGRSHQ